MGKSKRFPAESVFYYPACINDNLVPANYYDTGYKAYRSGDYETAIENLTKAVSYDETNSDELRSVLGLHRRIKGHSLIAQTCMSYMAVLSAALAIRRGAHIRMTAFDVYLPKIAVKVLDILAPPLRPWHWVFPCGYSPGYCG